MMPSFVINLHGRFGGKRRIMASFGCSRCLWALAVSTLVLRADGLKPNLPVVQLIKGLEEKI